MQITQADAGMFLLILSILVLGFYAGYYTALKQAKEAIRYARSVVRANNQNN